MHKTFTRVVTRQFDAHNIDSHFSRFSRIPIVCIYIYFSSSSFLRSFHAERTNFIFPPLFLLPANRKRKGRSYRYKFLSDREQFIPGRKRSLCHSKEDAPYRHRPTVEISNRVESLSPRATSGTLYYPDVVPLPTRARNTFSRGYSRAYLITGFNCFRESVLSFRRFLDVPLFQGNPRVSIRANIPNMRLKKRARSIIRVSNVTRERKKKRAFFLLIYILNSSRAFESRQSLRHEFHELNESPTRMLERWRRFIGHDRGRSLRRTVEFSRERDTHE